MNNPFYFLGINKQNFLSLKGRYKSWSIFTDYITFSGTKVFTYIRIWPLILLYLIYYLFIICMTPELMPCILFYFTTQKTNKCNYI